MDVIVIRIILIASFIPLLFATLYALINFKRIIKPLQFFCYYVFLSFIIQAWSLILAFTKHNNMPLLHFYVVAGFLLLALFYKEVLSEYINTRIIWFVAILFSLFSIFNSIWLQPIKSFNSNALTVQSVLILIVTIFTYIVFLNKIVKEKNKKDIPALNWINSGLFIYNASNLLIFYFGSSMMRSAIVKKLPVEMVVGTWLLHAFFLAIMYICFLIGLFKAQKE